MMTEFEKWAPGELPDEFARRAPCPDEIWKTTIGREFFERIYPTRSVRELVSRVEDSTFRQWIARDAFDLNIPSPGQGRDRNFAIFDACVLRLAMEIGCLSTVPSSPLVKAATAPLWQYIKRMATAEDIQAQKNAKAVINFSDRDGRGQARGGSTGFVLLYGDDWNIAPFREELGTHPAHVVIELEGIVKPVVEHLNKPLAGKLASLWAK